LLVAGFVMIFFIQVAGNSMQIFASEVFPTNARASGFGWAAGVGRLATTFVIPVILVIKQNYGLTEVFVFLAIILLIAAAAVTQLGPEAKQKGLDEIEPPTTQFVETSDAFWLKFGGGALIGLSCVWWFSFYLGAREIGNGFPCLFYTTARCETVVTAAELAGQWAYHPYFLWVGVALILSLLVLAASRQSVLPRITPAS
jgi:hypothetical protein